MANRDKTFRDESLPELKKDALRIYSMRFCPYAQRTRLVLNHKNIDHEVINVDTVHKPQWFLDKTPTALVPVLERNDEIVFESLICDEWLEDNYGGEKVSADNIADKYRWKLLVSLVDSKVVRAFFAYTFAKDATSRDELEKEYIQTLKWLEQQLGDKPYFAGDRVGLVDFEIYPFLERTFNLHKYNAPKLLDWRERMQLLPSVKATIINEDTHRKFFTAYSKARKEGSPMDFDFDLEE